jgi:hypothetical protein
LRIWIEVAHQLQVQLGLVLELEHPAGVEVELGVDAVRFVEIHVGGPDPA